MTIKVVVKQLVPWFLVLLLTATAVFAQTPPPPPGNPTPPPPDVAQPVFSQPELDQMLAPIALYPDALLSQILMAATYPLEVVQAARWSRANANLKGEQAVNAVAQNNWDPSVKSLVAFPQIIQMMDERLDWTERLGDAFLSQETQVMDTIQNLRQRAYAAGNLKSSDQIYVEPQGQNIVVAPANPEVIYVPYYYPTMIYGPWWWPAYPPVYWGPWPGYYVGPVITVGFFYGFGVPVSPHFFFGACDWRVRRVNVAQVNNHYFNYNTYVNRQRTIYHVVNVTNTGAQWGHDPAHRRGVPYRSLPLRQQFSHVSVAPETRRDFRGYAPSLPQAPVQGPNVQGARPELGRDSRSRPEEQPGNTRTIVGSTGAKPATGTAPTRPIVSPPSVSRPSVSPPSVSRPGVSPPSVSHQEPRGFPAHPVAPPAQPQPNAFEDIDHGAQVRNYSARGRESFHPAAPRPSAPAAPSTGNVPAAGSSGNAPVPQPSGSPSGGGTMRR